MGRSRPLKRKGLMAIEPEAPWSPDYPTPAAQRYRAEFLAGIESAGLVAVPEDLLSKAIDRAIGASWPAQQGGKLFGMLHLAMVRRRKPPLDYPTYLLAAFEKEMEA